MLRIGSATPDLALIDTSGREIHLSDFQGKEHVLLYFMRSATCPVCNNHVKSLARQAAEFEGQHVRVIIAVPEDREVAAGWQAKRRIPFLVVAGPNGAPHEAVGLTRKVFGSMRQSGSLLIDRGGVVRHVHAATVPTNSYDKVGIATAIAELPTIGSA